MELTPRDIDRVLITGAGASCEFGIGGARLPVMTDWAESLVKKLVGSDSGYLGATGLSGGLSAQQFEERLGKFLRDVLAFSQLKNLVAVSKHFAHTQPNLSMLATEG